MTSLGINTNSNYTIMLVDDEPHQLKYLKLILTDAGYNVIKVEKAKTALKILNTTLPDIIISDLIMPEIDGIETMAKMKEIDPETYFIILTGYGTVESAVEAMKIGAYDYLGKPINLDELEIIIERIREELDMAPVPEHFKGAPITLIIAGLLALAFMGFAGLISG